MRYYIHLFLYYVLINIDDEEIRELHGRPHLEPDANGNNIYIAMHKIILKF